jgi:hypothetical protein
MSCEEKWRFWAEYETDTNPFLAARDLLMHEIGVSLRED